MSSRLEITTWPAERTSAIPFTLSSDPYEDTPRVPLLALELQPLEPEDQLLVTGECELNWKPFGQTHQKRGVFVCSQLRLLHTVIPPQTDTVLRGLPLTPGAIGVNANASVPYVHLNRTGARVMTASDGLYLTRPIAVLYVWVRSEAARPGDTLPVFVKYGQLHVLRLRHGA